MNKAEIVKILRLTAISGNILFILWMTWNGIDEGFAGTIYQKISYVGLTLLLILNIILIHKRKL